MFYVYFIDVDVEKFDERLIVIYLVILYDKLEVDLNKKFLKRFVLFIKIIFKKLFSSEFGD